MSVRPLLVVTLAVVGLHHILRGGFVAMHFARDYMDERSTFSYQMGTDLGAPLMLTGNSLFWARFAAAALPLVAALVVFVNRRALAARLAGPSEPEQSFVSRGALLSAALASLGVMLVLDSLNAFGDTFSMTRAWVSSSASSGFWASFVWGFYKGALIEPSIRMVIGAVLIFAHPVFAMWGASSRDR